MLMPKQIWRNVNGIKGLEEYANYQVSNTGKVRNIETRKILKPRNCKGYLRVHLSLNGKLKDFYIHRLVCLAFILNPNNLPCVNHKDENSINNIWTNLEWCDYKYNNNYGSRTKRSFDTRNTKVICVETGEIFLSPNEASKQLGLHHNGISACCKGKQKTSGGYHWEYVD